MNFDSLRHGMKPFGTTYGVNSKQRKKLEGIHLNSVPSHPLLVGMKFSVDPKFGKPVVHRHCIYQLN